MRDQAVLVTGGTGALGAAVALAALEADATAVVTYRDARDRDTLAGRAPSRPDRAPETGRPALRARPSSGRSMTRAARREGRRLLSLRLRPRRRAGRTRAPPFRVAVSWVAITMSEPVRSRHSRAVAR